ncbi:MAG: conjugal transfer protein TraE, partial [Christensenella sp.]
MQDTKKHKISANKPLTAKQRRQISDAVKKAKMQGKIAMSAQQTISYEIMYPDGICRVTDKLYTKTLHFFDINYQLARNEDKNIIFESYCDFLNYFDKSITVQLSFLNQIVDMSEFEKAVNIENRNDGFNDIRREYVDMLKSQLARGNNGLVKNKYITFGIEADNFQAAKQRLERIEADILN